MRSSLVVLVIGLCALSNFSACIMDFTRELVSSQRFVVGEYSVEEQIYRMDSFPDPRFERIYHVESPAYTFELGRYEDEDTTGIEVPPQLLSDWLVVMSGAHIFFWQAGQEIRHFYPFVADDWVAYAQPRQLNGHYDYAAATITIDGNRWRMTYTCTYCLAEQPEAIHFVSEDGGISFHLDGE